MSDLSKYKICPICGVHNDPSLFECIKCNADIFSERVVDEHTELLAQTLPIAVGQPLFRFCECGEQNPPQARKCSVCGEDISDIQPRPVPQEQNYNLNSLDGQVTLVIGQGETILGRDATLKEYFAGKPFVSRKQARIVRKGDTVTIENLNSTNYTFVNNERIKPGVTELHDGDEIGLGGICKEEKRQDDAAYFVVRIGTCI